jgi:ABC-type dipeptide/oligopeptide/nickel transport system permease component
MMAKYILKRLLMMILVIIFSAFIIFTIMYFVPGDPAIMILGKSATAAQLAAKRAELGLNDPYIVRLGHFMSQVFLHFDFGVSWTRSQPVTKLIIERLPRTMLIGFTSVVLGTVVGVLLGVMAATHQGKVRDGVSLLIAMIGMAVPAFWLAIELVVLFSLKLHWLPGFGVGNWKHYVIPIIAASLGGIGIVTRQTRSSVLETLRADFVQSARAKGASESRVTFRHMLPNALIPVITVTGFAFAVVLSSLIIIEMVFSIPGIGMLLMNGINGRDYPIVQGVVIFLSFVTTFVMLLTDLAYAVVDPRIMAQYKGTARV